MESVSGVPSSTLSVKRKLKGEGGGVKREAGGGKSKSVQLEKAAPVGLARKLKLTLEDVTCPICWSILYEPTTLPCMHSLCMACYLIHSDQTSINCPCCRRRLSIWSRKAKKNNDLLDEGLWKRLKNEFPNEIIARENGIDPQNLHENLSCPPEIRDGSICNEPGAVYKDLKLFLKPHEDDLEQQRWQAETASINFIRQLEEEEKQRLARNEEMLEKDLRLAKILEEDYNRAGTPRRSCRDKKPNILFNVCEFTSPLTMHNKANATTKSKVLLRKIKEERKPTVNDKSVTVPFRIPSTPSSSNSNIYAGTSVMMAETVDSKENVFGSPHAEISSNSCVNPSTVVLDIQGVKPVTDVTASEGGHNFAAVSSVDSKVVPTDNSSYTTVSSITVHQVEILEANSKATASDEGGKAREAASTKVTSPILDETSCKRHVKASSVDLLDDLNEKLRTTASEESGNTAAASSPGINLLPPESSSSQTEKAPTIKPTGMESAKTASEEGGSAAAGSWGMVKPAPRESSFLDRLTNDTFTRILMAESSGGTPTPSQGTSKLDSSRYQLPTDLKAFVESHSPDEEIIPPSDDENLVDFGNGVLFHKHQLILVESDEEDNDSTIDLEEVERAAERLEALKQKKYQEQLDREYAMSLQKRINLGIEESRGRSSENKYNLRAWKSARVSKQGKSKK